MAAAAVYGFTGGLAADGGSGGSALTTKNAVTATEKPADAFQRQYNLISPEGAGLILAYRELRSAHCKAHTLARLAWLTRSMYVYKCSLYDT